MGGSGSGRWKYHEKKRTTEVCWTLDVADLPQGTLARRSPSGVLRVDRLSGIGSSVLCVRWVLNLEGKGPVLTLSFRPCQRVERREFIERVRLLTTKPHFGGARSWFACPFSSKDGEPCGRRVGKLYLPPGELRFGCRECHSLTYRSTQESHQYDRVFALIAGETSGETFEAVKEVFSWMRRASHEQRKSKAEGLLEAFDKEFR